MRPRLKAQRLYVKTRSGRSSTTQTLSTVPKQTHIERLRASMTKEINDEVAVQDKAINLYKQGEQKELTGLMRDAIILYRSAIKVSL